MLLRNKNIIIGVSGQSLYSKSVRAVMSQIRRMGGQPEFLSCYHHHCRRQIPSVMQRIHGLVVMGNDYDIDPEEYIYRYPANDQKRKRHPCTKSERNLYASSLRASYEKRLLKAAIKIGMPTLGICGGMQRINILCGGTLHQHLPDLVGDNKHMQCSQGIAPYIAVVPIIIKDNTLLSDIACNIRMAFCTDNPKNAPKVVMENSIHHQSIDRIGDGLQVCAITDTVPMKDGRAGYLPEAIEPDPEGPYRHQFLLGVQWHPEFRASPLGNAIMKTLIWHAEKSKTNKHLSNKAQKIPLSTIYTTSLTKYA